MPTEEKIEHSEDLMEVCNIDEGCYEITEERLSRDKKVFNENGQQVAVKEWYFEHWNHKDGFLVRWGKQPFSIKPGKTRVMPRYLANHYANHLSDHIFNKMVLRGEVKEGSRKFEKEKLINKIIIGVYEYHLQQPTLTEAEQAVKIVENLNKPESVVNNEEIPTTKKQKKEKKELTKEKLIESCEKLDIKLTGKESKAELKSKIKEFTQPKSVV